MFASIWERVLMRRYSVFLLICASVLLLSAVAGCSSLSEAGTGRSATLKLSRTETGGWSVAFMGSSRPLPEERSGQEGF